MISIAEDPAAVAVRAASELAGMIEVALATTGGCCVALSGGSMPGPVLRELQRHAVPWTKLRFVFVDERCVPPDHPESNFRGANEALFAPLRIRPDQIFRMEGERTDREQAARDYESRLPARIDVALLGIGEDGHFASIFPGSRWLSETKQRVAAISGSPKPPPDRLTLTPAAFAGTAALMVATGSGKAQAVARALRPETTPDEVPSRLWLGARWWLDRAAAAGLPAQTKDGVS